jgi:hypothetical protein
MPPEKGLPPSDLGPAPREEDLPSVLDLLLESTWAVGDKLLGLQSPVMGPSNVVKGSPDLEPVRPRKATVLQEVTSPHDMPTSEARALPTAP